MKRCTKCQRDKDESEFYRLNSSGRFHSWCKDCVKANSIRQGPHRSWKTPTAASTKLVRQILLDRGIPSCPGTAMGLDKVDLMAWACVPIEAKLARESAPDKFIWTFTRGQVSKLDGLIICVADYGDRHRILVIPAEQVKYPSEERTERRGSLCVTINSFDLRSQWPVYMKYEDRFDLIEVERRKFMERGGAWGLLNPLPAGDGDSEWA